jgi:alkylated DNA repair dioxygenase AlkB
VLDAIVPDHLPPPPGLQFVEEAVTLQEEATLIELIEASDLRPFALDPDNPRSTRTFGWLYDARDDTIAWGEPLPCEFHFIRDRAAAFTGIDPDDLVECLLIRYDPGAIIQPHLDKPAWDHVIGVSLGAANTMHFRKPLGGDYLYAQAPLPRRSMYLLAGEARHAYQHSLPAIDQVRWSMTFRSLSAIGETMR